MIKIFQYFAQFANNPANCDDNASLTCIPNPPADNDAVATILAIVFGIVTAVTVLIVVIQGVRFALSGGDPQKAAEARKGVIYSLVGLAIVLTADAIVAFVITRT